MFIVFLVLYTAGLVTVGRLSHGAGVKSGVLAGSLAIVANVGAFVLGASLRASMAPVIAILAGVAAAKAFTAADDGPRDDQLERRCNQAGQGLVAVALTEGTMALVAGFIWAINSA